MNPLFRQSDYQVMGNSVTGAAARELVMQLLPVGQVVAALALRNGAVFLFMAEGAFKGVVFRVAGPQFLQDRVVAGGADR